MPSPLRSPKTLSEWIELDYFRRRRLFRKLWKPVTWGTLVLCCLAAGWTFLPGKQAVYQAGPVSTAHAMFGADCARCHTESFGAFRRLWQMDDSVRSVSNQACMQCHPGPLHHTCVAQRSCASCHHEHHGQAALARVNDSHCLSCHADLKCEDGSIPQDYDRDDRRHITGFSEGLHPDFRLWQQQEPTDPGTIRFNHKAHLDGLIDVDRELLKRQKEDLKKAGAACPPEELRKQPRQLECNSCHQMDMAGRYMMPIRYEKHCQECHPLSIQLVGDWKGAARERACDFGKEPAPHPVSPQKAEAVRASVRDRLTRFIQARDNQQLLVGGKAEQTLTPKILGWRQADPVSPEEFAWVNDQQGQVERILFDGSGGCRYCHQEKTTPARRPSGLPEYASPAMNGVDRPWLEHAVFSHAKHTMLRCEACHDTASRRVRESTTEHDILMPHAGSCLECHRTGTAAQARSDCVECHRYHDPQLKREFQGKLSSKDLHNK